MRHRKFTTEEQLEVCYYYKHHTRFDTAEHFGISTKTVFQYTKNNNFSKTGKTRDYYTLMNKAEKLFADGHTPVQVAQELDISPASAYSLHYRVISRKGKPMEFPTIEQKRILLGDTSRIIQTTSSIIDSRRRHVSSSSNSRR